MEGSHRGPIEPEQAAALEHAIDDGLREVVVMQDAAPGVQRLVRREDHRAAPTMPFVDDMKQHVCGVGAVGEIADLVDLCGASHKSINATPAVMWSGRAAQPTSVRSIRSLTSHYREP